MTGPLPPQIGRLKHLRILYESHQLIHYYFVNTSEFLPLDSLVLKVLMHQVSKLSWLYSSLKYFLKCYIMKTKKQKLAFKSSLMGLKTKKWVITLIILLRTKSSSLRFHIAEKGKKILTFIFLEYILCL